MHREILIVISTCLLIGATLIFVYTAYAHHHADSDCSISIVNNQHEVSAYSKTPGPNCYGTFRIYVKVSGKQGNLDVGNFYGKLDRKIEMKGPVSSESYAGSSVFDGRRGHGPPNSPNMDDDACTCRPGEQ